MLLQTTFHYYKIVFIVIKVVSPDISKLEHVVPSICVQEDLFLKSQPKRGSLSIHNSILHGHKVAYLTSFPP